MVKRMLIDAVHTEETRVVVIDDNKVDQFEYETTTKKQLKGNIYLAKVTRVEPSLQAAFVDYGGNRHGFLPFSEIHPDYYHIPVEDQKAITSDETLAEDQLIPEDDDFDSSEATVNDSLTEEENKDSTELAEDETLADASAEQSDSEAFIETDTDIEDIEAQDLDKEAEQQRKTRGNRNSPRRRRPRKLKNPFFKNYKIQEVIKSRQILLVQVTKEERGKKGAALTTYLSLPGRYCVFMPNTPNSGGISRKITNPALRKKLKSSIDHLKSPDGVSVIIRTAGVQRTKTEIKRDYDYLVRLWEEVRSLTLESIAPCTIYKEDELIKRAIRDIYSRDISEIVIEGEEGYKVAKNFMKLLMPSHAKRVKKYKDDNLPLFQKHKVEKQLDEIHNPVVKLKSGGTIVINITEALVSIDINSARATGQRHIEETAYQTNIEAAEEIARQIRLRDLGGLVVIDFIDMQNDRYVQSIERKLKDFLRHDRARIQVGNISLFGLLELSRQRLRPSLIEAYTRSCPTCHGSGRIRSIESSALLLLRSLEEEALEKRLAVAKVWVPAEVALYIFNEKRENLQSLEERYNLTVKLYKDDNLIPPNYKIEKSFIRKNSDKEADETLVKEDKQIEQAQPQKQRPNKNTRRTRQNNKPRDEQENSNLETESKAPRARRNTRNPQNKRGPSRTRYGQKQYNKNRNVKHTNVAELPTEEFFEYINKIDSEISENTVQTSVDFYNNDNSSFVTETSTLPPQEGLELAQEESSVAKRKKTTQKPTRKKAAPKSKKAKVVEEVDLAPPYSNDTASINHKEDLDAEKNVAVIPVSVDDKKDMLPESDMEEMAPSKPKQKRKGWWNAKN